jgi:hypothetical protein
MEKSPRKDLRLKDNILVDLLDAPLCFLNSMSTITLIEILLGQKRNGMTLELKLRLQLLLPRNDILSFLYLKYNYYTNL